jgi:hypothetical protein
VAVVTAATVITKSLFVFRVATLQVDDTYDRVATPYDIDTYPEVRDPDKDFYRLDTATFDFDAVDAGIQAKLDLNARMLLAAGEYDKATDSFVEVLTVVHDSDA